MLFQKGEGVVGSGDDERVLFEGGDVLCERFVGGDGGGVEDDQTVSGVALGGVVEAEGEHVCRVFVQWSL